MTTTNESENLTIPLYNKNSMKMKYMGMEDDSKSESSETPIQSEETTKNIPLNLGERLDRRKRLVHRRRWIVNTEFVLAMTGIALMMLETELYMANYIEKSGVISFTIKCVISASTGVLLMAICMNYYTSAQIKALDAGVKELMSVITTWNICTLVLEVIVCSIHTVPGNFMDEYVSPTGVEHEVSSDAVLSILMLSRLYLVAKFSVVHSRLLTDTSTHSIGALSKVKINSVFVFKAVMTNKPVQTLCVVMLSTFLINTWAMRTCELYYQRGEFKRTTYLDAMWWIAITFLTVGYETETPKSYCGRYISVVTGAMGVITTALLVAVIARCLQQSRAESYVFNFVSRMQIQSRKKKAAADAIKAVLRLSILKGFEGNEEGYKKEIRKYEDRLKQSLKAIKEAKEDMDHIGDDAVGLVDVAHNVDKIITVLELQTKQEHRMDDRVMKIEQRIENIDRKMDEFQTTLLSYLQNK